jgi:hypothetical protein
MDIYIVSGPCEVAGVAPGGTVSREVLDGLAANVPALIEGGHLKPAPKAEQPATLVKGKAKDAG